jgi:hypothetical protein
MSNIYCGIKPVPKGKELGTAEQCIKANQTRYWGVKPLDAQLLNEKNSKKPNLIQEQLKLRKYYDDAKVLMKEYKNLKIIADSEKVSNSERKKAETRMNKLLQKKEVLKKNIEKQSKYVKQLESAK